MLSCCIWLVLNTVILLSCNEHKQSMFYIASHFILEDLTFSDCVLLYFIHFHYSETKLLLNDLVVWCILLVKR